MKLGLAKPHRDVAREVKDIVVSHFVRFVSGRYDSPETVVKAFKDKIIPCNQDRWESRVRENSPKTWIVATDLAILIGTSRVYGVPAYCKAKMRVYSRTNHREGILSTVIDYEGAKLILTSRRKEAALSWVLDHLCESNQE
jgi:hypothetical protein